jgi:hypothetical protein
MPLTIFKIIFRNDSGQPQGIAPTYEYFRKERLNIVVGAILYGCPESLQFFNPLFA